jgi:hypothetical protein
MIVRATLFIDERELCAARPPSVNGWMVGKQEVSQLADKEKSNFRIARHSPATKCLDAMHTATAVGARLFQKVWVIV